MFSLVEENSTSTCRPSPASPPAAADTKTQPAPNTRSLIFVDRGVGPGVRPVLGQVSPEGAGAHVGLGPSRFLVAGGVPTGSTGGGARAGGGGALEAKVATKARQEATVVPLRCYCGARRSHHSLCSG
jgi:hypothetical protein